MSHSYRRILSWKQLPLQSSKIMLHFYFSLLCSFFSYFLPFSTFKPDPSCCHSLPIQLVPALQPFGHVCMSELLLFFTLPCGRLRILCPYTLPLQLTPPGTLTAHTKSTLVLLHSCPDTVQWHILRETQTSTPLIKGSYTNADPLPSITPAIADCRYKAPLTPRLHGASIITSEVMISQCHSYFFNHFV